MQQTLATQEGRSLKSYHGLAGPFRPQARLVGNRILGGTGLSLLGTLSKLKNLILPKDENSSTGVVATLIGGLLSRPLIVLGGVLAALGAGYILGTNLFGDSDEPSEVKPDLKPEPSEVSVPEKSTFRSIVDTVKSVLLKEDPVVMDRGGLTIKTPKKDSPVKKAPKASPFTVTVDQAISAAVKETGTDEGLLRSFISIESGGDPLAKHGSFLGLGQLGPDAWLDVQKVLGKLPPLTRDKNDPRYDPVLNARATGAYLAINRNRLMKAALSLGQTEPTPGQLYAAHNLGATRAIEMMTQDSSQFSKKTLRAIDNQAKELKKGGASEYLQNAEQSMRSHYAKTSADESEPSKYSSLSLPKAKSSPGSVIESTKVSEAGSNNVTLNPSKTAASPISVVQVTTVIPQPDVPAQQNVGRQAYNDASIGRKQSYSQNPPSDIFRDRNGMLVTTG